MHSSAFFTMASNLPVMKLCVFSHELILRFTRFFLSLKQSLPLLDLCQKINPTKVKVEMAYLTRTVQRFAFILNKKRLAEIMPDQVLGVSQELIANIEYTCAQMGDCNRINDSSCSFNNSGVINFTDTRNHSRGKPEAR
ncbi:hypothetical protein P8452_58705 [Trifolium repens]|nr:hypothetical protein P8452_58705 [Trifolium repens]